ncbi:alpha/beta hydrolase [Gordonia polyisoprenivorans]|uniref:alpha/beta hydrolase n=1 Tax=Gordonia polyisoprenivorans TaxID=84595 RepID=UPI001FCACBCE|nr:alpha/beta fold hydrolase [Gordonia polyisoprenivorans]
MLISEKVPSPRRETIRFASGDSFCGAWLYTPTNTSSGRPLPVVVMGHGMGATREMGLEPFAKRFAAEGIAVVAFTYRNFGDSGGTARQLVSVTSQLEDWESALSFVSSDARFDSTRIGIWGTSFGGGHAITVASRHPELRAAVAQCPFTDGTASAGVSDFSTTVAMMARVGLDQLARFGARGSTLPIAAAPGHMALMNTPDALNGYQGLIPADFHWTNHVAARSLPNIIRYRPGRSAKKIAIPILFCVSTTDSVAPPEKTLHYAEQAPHGDIKTYTAGHFDFYLGSAQQQLATDQAAFLRKFLLGEDTAEERAEVRTKSNGGRQQ